MNRFSDSPTGQRGFTLLELLVVLTVITTLISLLLPAVQQSREHSRMIQCRNNLMQLGIGLNNYAMAHGVLPSGSVNQTGPIVASGKPTDYQMSWIAQILPHIGQSPLYSRIDFNLSAYHETNAAVNALRIPGILHCNSNNEAGPHYCGVHNDYEAPIDMNQNGVLFLNSSIRSRDVRDGLANTLFLVEGLSSSGSGLGWISGTSSTLRNVVVWENIDQPDEQPRYRFRLEAASSGESIRTQLKNLEKRTPDAPGGPGSRHNCGYNVLLGDGRVKMISLHLDTNLLRNLAHRSDGEMLGDY